MKNLYAALLAFFSVCVISEAQMLDTVRIAMTDIDGETPISSDDAEQINNEIDKLYDDDLDVGWEGDEFNIATVGLRFTNINVPQGAVIDSAFIEVFSHEDEGDPAFITIWGQDADDTETFNDTDLITDRPRTDAEVRWEVTEEWTIWTKYRTVDLAPVVQEIVDREGWEAGNSMVFVLTGEDQGASNEDNARDMEAFENVEDPDDGGDGLNHPERIPKLFIYFSETSSTADLEKESAFRLHANVITNRTVQMSYNGASDSPMTVNLYNAAGALVANVCTDLPIGESMTYNLPDVQPGMYILRAESRDRSYTEKIVIR